eukprot:CAMPEP_0172183114 /NCGR_PEP_ID=MMETSP1050-20130122/18797_1 /TAXON_ID=233186 /ORGANISM="Cryptomonas curvata, Strain CCAP979/52" /LENGTH=211 /DNA_ID=CAMNT_0012856679 /DNA_START=325 /DNA_END=957 /DNA_ORIENTATION=-
MAKADQNDSGSHNEKSTSSAVKHSVDTGEGACSESSKFASNDRGRGNNRSGKRRHTVSEQHSKRPRTADAHALSPDAPPPAPHSVAFTNTAAAAAAAEAAPAAATPPEPIIESHEAAHNRLPPDRDAGFADEGTWPPPGRLGWARAHPPPIYPASDALASAAPALLWQGAAGPWTAPRMSNAGAPAAGVSLVPPAVIMALGQTREALAAAA